MTKPTDLELRQLAEECGVGWAAGIPGMYDFIRVFAHKVLDRWGTPNAKPRDPIHTVQGPAAIVYECGNLYAKVKLCGEAFGTTKVGDRLYNEPIPPSDDTSMLDWLSHAGPVSICLVVDRPHDGEYEVSTDYVTGYGRTLREAIRAALVAQGEKLG